MSIVKEVMSFWDSQGLLWTMDITPKIMSMIGGHCINLRNRGFRMTTGLDGNVSVSWDGNLKRVYGEASGADLRSHFLIVGEPATGKSIWGNQLLDPEHGLFTGILPNKFMDRVTVSGLVGQKHTDRNGDINWERGALANHSNEVLFFEEFASLTNAMKSNHSSDLTSVMLTGLDSGRVITNIGGVEDEFVTRTTLFGGVQPQRFEKISGFERRFMFHRNPVLNEGLTKRYKQSSFGFDSQTVNKEKRSAIREGFISRITKFPFIDRVRFSDEFIRKVVGDKTITAEQVHVVKRAAIGFWMMEMQNISSDIIIPLNNNVEALVRDVIEGWGQTMSDPIVYEIIRDNELPMSILELSLVKERVATSRRTAKRAIDNCLQHYLTRGVTSLRLKPPNSVIPWVRIPTGLPVEHFVNKGYKFICEENPDGTPYVPEEELVINENQ